MVTFRIKSQHPSDEYIETARWIKYPDRFLIEAIRNGWKILLITQEKTVVNDETFICSNGINDDLQQR